MELKDQVKLGFNGVDIVNINFKALSPRSEEMKFDINCVPKIYYPEDDSNKFNIIMDVEINCEKHFELSLSAIGNFEIGEDIEEELKSTLMRVNSPAIMFPYVRSFISTLSSNMGRSIGSLVIPTQFFQGEIEEVKLSE